jgi:aryl-alcohol dehydrogenase-like predicted oxidoreductase
MSLQYNKLGDSGLHIAPVIVGCMSYGDKRWAPWVLDDENEIMKLMKKCYDSGLRTFDTADVYSSGKSEILLKKFMEKYNIARNKIQILTKLYFPFDEQDPGSLIWRGDSSYPLYEFVNAQGLSRVHILEAAEASVRRLGTHIDVLQIHRLDQSTPKKEIMRALNDVVEKGYTRYIGASSMKAVEFVELQYLAELNGWHKFISMQSFYNLIAREDERELIPFCKSNELGEVGLIPWSPIARGILARPVGTTSEFGRNNESDKTQSLLGLDNLSDADKTIISRIEEVAKKHGVSMAIIATAWVISKGCNPIVGLNSEKRIDEAVAAALFQIHQDDMKYLEEAYVPKNSIV